MIRFLRRALSLLLTVYLLGYAAFAISMPDPAGDERTDAIVVLTGGTGRLDRGFDLLRRGVSHRMFISGVAPSVRPQELAAAFNVDPRLVQCCVVLGRDAVDTRSNADEVAQWLARAHVRSIRLVTNDVHMRRARYEMSKTVGANVAILADAVPADADIRQIFVEYNKYLLGWLADLVGV